MTLAGRKFLFRTTPIVVILTAAVFLVCFRTSIAAVDDGGLAAARVQLRSVYGRRTDLQGLFAADTWLPIKSERTVGLIGLEDWARRYGCREHSELIWYCSGNVGASTSSGPSVLIVRSEALVPVRSSATGFDFSTLGSTSVFVADFDSRRVILEKDANVQHTDAAVAKLITAITALGSVLSLDTVVDLASSGQVGGTQLGVATGTKITVEDLVYASLTGSANDAAISLALVNSSQDAFVVAMNDRARELGLSSTILTGPTGVESGNLTTAREAAAVLIEAMGRDPIRRALSSSKRTVAGMNVTNSNELLTDPNNGLYVYGGKVGYLRSSGWHLVVDMRELSGQKRLVIALSGAPTKEALFADAAKLGRWVWSNYKWQVSSDTTSNLTDAAPVISSGGRPLVQSTDPSLLEARGFLRTIYDKRGDLKTLFDVETWRPIHSERTGDIANLDDWAVRFGHLEYDSLWWYGTAQAKRLLAGDISVIASSPRALTIRNSSLSPVRVSGTADFRPSLVTARSVFVIDVPTRKVLLAEDANRMHPVASITKLMTGIVAIDHGIDFEGRQTLLNDDEIGGARLRVPIGTSMYFADLMYSMLVGSANNAAHAIGRIAGGGDLDRFVDMMNDRAAEFGLANTNFVDPSGLDVHNVSTARELAALALEAWDHDQLQRICSTSKYSFQAGPDEHTLINTNKLLTDANNGLIVLGGKTGYLVESKWNLVVDLKDSREHPVLVVVLGSDGDVNLFRDARVAAEWAWSSYRWP
ncbi:hypothetical protein A2480_01525 [Candidatus Uhrbacteria bacterium RIFOXYC2_FULL_47_19]|uniref:Peptidase S11 D-alanyl-D-alanine carboxypeptidase A N-terminal domain-containing protein n=1 Tax=Candidatus Uhrbacteria bacterium RIFOXYC2_FULL_47_19 TaxID=1802424 RepID=A0A1F7WGB6_9BACT|nr:MAG: hypothetical protein A2480_01525 [Candidatus Uhrbacteria bacterium RIFOXYC2_FULL_47_19]